MFDKSAYRRRRSTSTARGASRVRTEPQFPARANGSAACGARPRPDQSERNFPEKSISKLYSLELIACFHLNPGLGPSSRRPLDQLGPSHPEIRVTEPPPTPEGWLIVIAIANGVAIRTVNQIIRFLHRFSI